MGNPLFWAALACVAAGSWLAFVRSAGPIAAGLLLASAALFLRVAFA